jgi:hypothetical protein
VVAFFMALSHGALPSIVSKPTQPFSTRHHLIVSALPQMT